jgi:hypothetical protein
VELILSGPAIADGSTLSAALPASEIVCVRLPPRGGKVTSGGVNVGVAWGGGGGVPNGSGGSMRPTVTRRASLIGGA